MGIFQQSLISSLEPNAQTWCCMATPGRNTLEHARGDIECLLKLQVSNKFIPNGSEKYCQALFQFQFRWGLHQPYQKPIREWSRSWSSTGGHQRATTGITIHSTRCTRGSSSLMRRKTSTSGLIICLWLRRQSQANWIRGRVITTADSRSLFSQINSQDAFIEVMLKRLHSTLLPKK